MKQINKTIEEFLIYAKIRLHLDDRDVDFYRNYLFEKFKVESIYDGVIDKDDIKNYKTFDRLFDKMFFHLSKVLNYSKEDSLKTIYEALAMVMPRQSKVQDEMDNLLKINPSKVIDYLYELSIYSSYVRKSKIDKNIFINGNIDNHKMIATINLSKPELPNIKKKVNDTNLFPKCIICKENIGRYTGLKNTLRYFELKLDNKDYFLQFSPFGYFNQHFIVISKKHLPMKVCEESVNALLDFIDIFPNYFIGSNADLPIVGGSILEHQHFQGGLYDMPIFEAKTKCEINSFDDNLSAYILDWPSFTILLKSKSKENIVKGFNKVFNKWKHYENKDIKIFDKSNNTFTLITKMIDDEYSLYITLRNNGVNADYKEGIFHARESLMHIKKEGIGIIENCGLFVLPGRLKEQLNNVEICLKNNVKSEDFIKIHEDLSDFKSMIDLIQDKTFANIDEYVIYACNEILKDINIFKFDNENKFTNEFIKDLFL